MTSVRTTLSCTVIVALVMLACVSAWSAAFAQPLPPPPRLPANVRFSVTLAGPPASSPAIAAGHAVVTLQGGTIAAYHLADGAEAWRIDVAAEQPLAADGDLLFAASGESIQALRVADGSIVWRATTSGAVAAPLLAQDGWVVALTASEVIALRASDGSIVWRRAGGSPAARASLEGDRAYVPLVDGRVMSLDLGSGAERWVTRLGGEPTELLPFADRVYAGAADTYFYCLDSADGTLVWRYRVGAALRGRPAAGDGRVFAGAFDNLLRAFDRGHGARSWAKSVPFRAISGPLVLGSTVVVPGPAADLPAFDGATGAPRAALPLGGPLAVAPAVAAVGGLTILAAVTGGISRGWTLVVLDSSFVLAVEPLTVLPGEVVPIAPPG